MPHLPFSSKGIVTLRLAFRWGTLLGSTPLQAALGNYCQTVVCSLFESKSRAAIMLLKNNFVPLVLLLTLSHYYKGTRPFFVV